MFKTSMLIFFLISLNAHTEIVKVGSSPVISSAGIYLAKERGYFKDQGLEIEITDFNNSGAQMTALLSKGELDVGAGNLSSGLFNAIAKGQQFKLVADKGHLEKNKEYIALIVRADHIASGRYKELKDLKGFKLGLTALDGVSQQIVIERFLKKANLTTKDITFEKLSYSEMNIALKTKTIDATIQLEPYLSKANIEGIAKTVISATDVHPTQQSAAIFYSPNFIQKRKADAQKFMRAYLKGIHDYNEAFIKNNGKEKAITDLKKYIKIDDDKVWNNMKPIGLYENGTIDKFSLSEDIKWYSEKKYLEKPINIDDAVDNSFALEAFVYLNSKK